jgi:hypothetical protein
MPGGLYYRRPTTAAVAGHARGTVLGSSRAARASRRDLHPTVPGAARWRASCAASASTTPMSRVTPTLRPHRVGARAGLTASWARASGSPPSTQRTAQPELCARSIRSW